MCMCVVSTLRMIVTLVPDDADRAMVMGGVASNTLRTYRGAPSLWKEFLSVPGCGLDPSDTYLTKMDLESQSVVINRFLNWMISGRSGGCLRPNSACRMITALRFWFVVAHRKRGCDKGSVEGKPR